MVCAYCDSYLVKWPDSGLCPHCGAALPAQEAPTPPPVYQQPPKVVYQVPLQPGINCCSRCMSRQITMKKRGFSAGLAIVGFFLIPLFGILLGLCGRNKLIYRCQTCGHKWKR